MRLKKGMRKDSNDGLNVLISVLPNNITMAEVGCYAGESTLMFMQSGKVNLLYAIDPWDWNHSKHMRWAEESFDFRLKGYNVIKCKTTLSEMVGKMPALDFIYIDGNHKYEYVKKDISDALKVVKEGGIIAGHDYISLKKFGVVEAVDEVFGKPDRVFRDTSWIKYL